MSSRKIVAVFETREAAQSARDSLLDLGLNRDHISIVDQSSTHHTAKTTSGQGSFWTHLKEMFMPDEDRSTIDESIRRGGFVVVATADDARADEAIARLERAGAVDLKERENQLRAGGWSPGAPAPLGTNTTGTASTAPSASARAAANTADSDVAGRGTADRIPVLEERLRVGRREVNRGTVRVRSFIVEEPVHEEVRLRDEHVEIERRPVNEPVRPAVAGAASDLFQERTVEVTESAEQAVVGKEARVTEEVVVSKTAGERVESIDDTVRRTRVDVEDNRNVEGSEQRAADRSVASDRNLADDRDPGDDRSLDATRAAESAPSRPAPGRTTPTDPPRTGRR